MLTLVGALALPVVLIILAGELGRRVTAESAASPERADAQAGT